MTPCSAVDGDQCFRETHQIHLYSRRNWIQHVEGMSSDSIPENLYNTTPMNMFEETFKNIKKFKFVIPMLGRMIMVINVNHMSLLTGNNLFLTQKQKLIIA
jgi:hypothetical protein